MTTGPTLDEIHDAASTLAGRTRHTPVWQWRGDELSRYSDAGEVYLKLELFQHTGTFKPRGALLNALSLSAKERARGVTAVSAGNHAIAVAWAARAVDSTAKVVMPKSANPFRVSKCRTLGAEVVRVDDVHQAFEEVERIEREEGRTFIHPFAGEKTVLGTATVGLEWAGDLPELDAIVVPIGGGGLIAGIAAAFKQLQPGCRVYGVEPEGADTMHRSFETGRPEAIEKVDTIADSLGAPYAKGYSFEVAREYVDELVRITDDQMRTGMKLLFEDMKLAVEPAGAATTAALCGPLHGTLAGKRVGLIVCGSNIDIDGFADFVRQAPETF